MKASEFYQLRNEGKIRPHVYFLAPVNGGPIKIGFSQWASNRLTTMMAWSPVPLELLASAPGRKAHEFHIHQIFAADRLHSEWFKPSPKLLNLIEEVKQTGALPTEYVPLFAPKPPSDELRSRLRLRALLASNGLKPRALMSYLGLPLKRMHSWDIGGVPEHFHAGVIAFFASCGITITIDDLYEFYKPDWGRKAA